MASSRTRPTSRRFGKLTALILVVAVGSSAFLLWVGYPASSAFLAPSVASVGGLHSGRSVRIRVLLAYPANETVVWSPPLTSPQTVECALDSNDFGCANPWQFPAEINATLGGQPVVLVPVTSNLQTYGNLPSSGLSGGQYLTVVGVVRAGPGPPVLSVGVVAISDWDIEYAVLSNWGLVALIDVAALAMVVLIRSFSRFGQEEAPAQNLGGGIVGAVQLASDTSVSIEDDGFKVQQGARKQRAILWNEVPADGSGGGWVTNSHRELSLAELSLAEATSVAGRPYVLRWSGKTPFVVGLSEESARALLTSAKRWGLMVQVQHGSGDSEILWSLGYDAKGDPLSSEEIRGLWEEGWPVEQPPVSSPIAQ